MTQQLPSETSHLLLLGELRGDVKSILHRLDEISQKQDRQEVEFKQRTAKLDTRISLFEGYRTKLLGVALGAGLFSPTVADWSSKAIAAISKVIA